ncbi:MAG: isoprenylcysteine carboxylmethyltransferase family protein [Bacteroidota bacterium]|jgi:protein-S-isoprenylcysteine O-methyltransferase Ste14
MRSLFLVVIQFSSVLVIVLFGTFPVTFVPLAILGMGMILGVAAIITMQLDNLRIFPEPKKNIRLVTSGPYRFIRHPMYTSVLLMTIAFIVESPTALLTLTWLILLSVLLGKISIEERLLPQILPDYIQYQRKSWKLIPYFF